MKLRVHYFDIIYGVAGSFFMDKLPDDKKKEVNKTWYKNCAAASLKSNVKKEKKIHLHMFIHFFFIS
jgi:hypothetical protein